MDKELVLENTPLHNLKSILNVVDASVSKQREVLGGGQPPDHPSAQEQGIMKKDVRGAIEILRATPGKYLSAAFIGKMTCQLLAADNAQGPQNDASENIYSNRLQDLVKYCQSSQL